MKLPNPRRMYERARWLRSDGKPNFKTAIRGKEPELRSLIVTELPAVTPQAPLMKCVEDMYRMRFRAAVVVKTGKVSGILTFHDIADYLGGGSRYRIVVDRYGGGIYKALSIPAQELMNKNVVHVSVADTLNRALELMVMYGFGLVPVLDPDGRLIGVITEGSVVRLYSGRVGRRPAGEFMTKSVITAGEESSLLDVLKLMVSTGVRRIPLTASDGRLRGVVTWRGILEFVGSHRVFESSKSGDMEEIHRFGAAGLVDRDVIAVEPSSPLESLVKEMFEKDLDYGLVVEGNVLRGILTERDIMFAVLSS